jgi:hypothetical protein
VALGATAIEVAASSAGAECGVAAVEGISDIAGEAEAMADGAVGNVAGASVAFQTAHAAVPLGSGFKCSMIRGIDQSRTAVIIRIKPPLRKRRTINDRITASLWHRSFDHAGT